MIRTTTMTGSVSLTICCCERSIIVMMQKMLYIIWMEPISLVEILKSLSLKETEKVSEADWPEGVKQFIRHTMNTDLIGLLDLQHS